MLKRYEFIINRGCRKPKEYKIYRANSTSPLVAQAQDLLDQDEDIWTITIMGPTYKEFEIVSR